MILGFKNRIAEERRKSPKDRTIGDWLEDATADLASPARHRVCLEIKAHYAQAVEGRLNEGLPGTEAEAAALAELGDPNAAADQFRKRHLTVSEAARIERTLKNYRHLGYLLFSFVLPCLMLWFLRREVSMPHFIGTIFAIIWFRTLVRAIGYSIARSQEKKANIRILLAAEILDEQVFEATFWVFFWLGLGVGSASWVIGVAVWIGATIRAFPCFRLLLKLSRVTDVHQELPPRGASVA